MRILHPLRFGLMVAIMVGATIGCRAGPACQAVAPADLTSHPTRWLGDCPGGRADGLGVLRAGAAEPYQFFAGAMHAGQPVRGILVTRDAFQVVGRFDLQGRDLSPRSWEPTAHHAVFVLGARASQATARRFELSRNAGSAAYYRRLALRIQRGEPE